MATRLMFIPDSKCIYRDVEVDFKWVAGISISQRVKCALSLHDCIKSKYNLRPLEISRASASELGRSLSAFNLKYDGYTFENVFQSSKVFEGNIQNVDILNVNPREAKRAADAMNLALIGFRYKGMDFPLVPRSLFYDYLYIDCVLKSSIDLSELDNYDCFTDCGFDQKKKFNCQARSIAILQSLRHLNLVEEAMKSPESFKNIVYNK